MKKIRLFQLASLLLIVVGCSQEEFLSENNIVVSAVMEEELLDTRSHATDEGKFTWSKGDKISVYTSSGNFRTFTLQGEGGTGTANFTGSLLNEETITQCAAYPKSSSHKVNGNTLTFNLPAEYGDFTAEYAANTNAAMIALMDNSTDFYFKHIGGVLRFKLDNVPVGAAQFVFTATDKDITGSFDVDLSAETPTITAREKTTANSITIKFKPLENVQNDMTFFVPLPIGTYNGFTIAMKKQDGTELVSYEHESSNTLKRKSLARFPKLKFADVSGSMEGEEQEAGTLVNGVAKLKEAGTLATVLGEQMLTLTSLKIIGEINGTDVKCLRQMLGSLEYNEPDCGKLTALDLSEATVISGGNAYYQSYQTRDNIIGEQMFINCVNLQTILIPNNTKSIAAKAFYGCTLLNSINIPDEIIEFQNSPFEGCNKLTNVYISNLASWCKIGNLMFLPHTNLYLNGELITNLVIPSEITEIRPYAFYGCNNITNVTIPEGVTIIGQNAFEGCSKLATVSIPNNMIEINRSAFSGCSSLENVIIPNTVSKIDYNTFNGCTSLKTINLGRGVNIIGREAFKNCSSLANIIIPNNVTQIEFNAFGGCSGLVDVVFGNGLTAIANYAFANCSSLSNIIIPDNVTTIGEHAFEYCSSLISVTIPNSVTTISESAFYGCSSLTSLTIPNSVTTIESFTFSGCSSLTNVTIPNSVTTIERFTFQNCSSLTNVTIPNSVTTIGESAFKLCSSLTSVTIPNSVTTIGESAFSHCI